ncbi:OmpP1/FadL family transporter [Hymenobacter psychrotolerans]|uniref:Outer membrane protein transport protein (OMPP1/FadL/TodX) n=1 Tax=Hymenobacter psychrotolerans DSM 18569 TaxID=1121959 RepID=A0A1M6PTQ4_9BACT|nr:hypothetical protein [Hymenobacter psychrotolerans]SHK11270.1 hypothetical protein SAMN02746009_00338 [Hymenobacter psychrotolerans DSM 18569]
MKNVKYWLALAFMGQASYGFAQYEVDALRFSQTQPSGTARTLGIGGASSAVGADLSSLVTNPAGLGLYQRSEFSFTPGLGLGSTDSKAFGTTTSDSRNSLHVASLGAAFVNRRPDSDGSDWRNGTFAIGLNRLNDYNQRFRYRGTPGQNQDILQRFNDPKISVANADDQYINGFYNLDGLAYGAFLTNPFTVPGPNGSNVEVLGLAETFENTGQLQQEETVLTTGSQTQFDFGYGASYRDRLYLGGAIGIVSSRYNSTSVITASEAQPDGSTAFNSLNYREVLETRGSGINLRVGAIYRINDAVRVSAAVQTPTWMRLTESYSSSLSATFDRPLVVDGQSYTSRTATSSPGEFDYTLTTPFKATGGVAVVIGKYGFLSGDVEYLNYSKARLDNDNSNDLVGGTDYDFSASNDAVRSLYTSAVNLRVGGELRFDIFRVRAGYARYGDAYKQNDFDRTQNFFTGGVGLRQKNFFLDAAAVYGTSKRFYSPYTLSEAGATPVVNIEGSKYTTTVTAGFLF